MEVFTTLDLSDELKGLLEFVRIDRVTLNRDRDFMRIFLESEKLIFKKHIFELEQVMAWTGWIIIVPLGTIKE